MKAMTIMWTAVMAVCLAMSIDKGYALGIMLSVVCIVVNLALLITDKKEL